MGKDKLKKWAENKTFDHVFEPPFEQAFKQESELPGTWHERVFGNDHPITLELGCGKGEYTVGLARMFPQRNFIGVDVKGHRFWRGARTAREEELNNVAFLRARIEFITSFFGEGEVDEIWLTFSDPQPRNEKKRITGPAFIDRYKKFLKSGATIHIKTDNTGLYEWTLEQLQEQGYEIEEHTPNVYGAYFESLSPEWQQIMSIRTYYEQKFAEEGEKIKYIQFRI
ncbi:MAG: tRNA (guanosine(46)-N7)-methyltransferase TrmB [Flavobacteriales bacterium]|nr:tRNA (guanosine(46)-N7)-methyltransferase TrmB [Flavobacteriales bacterium]